MMAHAQRMAQQMRLQALLALGLIGRPRVGVVTAYDPSSHAAKVTLQPTGEETGLIPVVSPWVGNGWGMDCPPSAGDQVNVLFQEGDPQVGFVIGSYFSDADRPPGAPSGEFWLVHKDGASIKLTNDGKITTAGPWVHTGDFTASGTITGQTDVLAGPSNISGKGHKHPGVQTGAGETGTPTNT